MVRLIFATNNTHKIEEIQAAVGNTIEVIGLKRAGINIDIPEPHHTLEANAAEKSAAIYALTGVNCFSEDTGLEIEALNGEPGVRSARYAGEGRSTDDNIDKVILAMTHAENRKARFRTVISLIWEGSEHLFEGICQGEIMRERKGTGGFGYDPIFRPENHDKTFAEMDFEEKNRVSHRKKAADQLVLFLQQHMEKTG